MRRRRMISAVLILLVIAVVIALDMRILTLPALVRLRVQTALASVFHRVGDFSHPTATYRGTIRVKNFSLKPPGGGYAISAKEMEARLDLLRPFGGPKGGRRVILRDVDLEWRRGPDGWDLAPFLRFCDRLKGLSFGQTRIEEIRIEGMEVTLRAGPEGQTWMLGLDEVEAEILQNGVEFRGSSTQPPWERLRFSVLADPSAGEFRGRIDIRSLRIHPDDLPLLPRAASEILGKLRPRGTADLHVTLEGGGRFTMRISPTNLSLRPTSFPYPLRKIKTGVVEVEPAGIRIIEDIEGGSRGMTYVVSGHVPLAGRPEDGLLHLSWKGLPIDETLAAALPEDLSWVWRQLQPHGTGGGELTLVFSEGRFAVSEGTLDLDPLVVNVPLPLSLRGPARLQETGHRPRLDLTGVLLEMGGISIGKTTAGAAILGDRDLIFGVEGSSSSGTYRGGYRRSRDWPFSWEGSLSLERADLGHILSSLSGTDGPRDGRCYVRLEARGDETRQGGRGIVWFRAPEGRQMPLLGSIFPPALGASPEVRGTLSLEVEQGALKVHRLVLESGSERAVGAGAIYPEGEIRFRILRSGRRQPGGPSDRTSVDRGSAAKIIIGGTVRDPRVETVPMLRAGRGFGR